MKDGYDLINIEVLANRHVRDYLHFSGRRVCLSNALRSVCAVMCAKQHHLDRRSNFLFTDGNFMIVGTLA
jgi:hypothetical protein